MIGIIGSLIFVGLELRQSQRIAQAGQQQDRTASFFGLLGANSEAGVDWQSTVYEANSEYGENLLYRRLFAAITIMLIYLLMKMTIFSIPRD